MRRCGARRGVRTQRWRLLGAPDDPDVHIPLEPGMTFTIEPMITVGSSENEKWADDWTVVTRDGSRTAQFEHTILVTGDGAEILTLP